MKLKSELGKTFKEDLYEIQEETYKKLEDLSLRQKELSKNFKILQTNQIERIQKKKKQRYRLYGSQIPKPNKEYRR